MKAHSNKIERIKLELKEFQVKMLDMCDGSEQVKTSYKPVSNRFQTGSKPVFDQHDLVLILFEILRSQFLPELKKIMFPF